MSSQRRNASSMAIALLTLFLVSGAAAHFNIAGPGPSREKQFAAGYRFWPIAGASPTETRQKTDCLMYPRGKVVNLTGGQSVKVTYEISPEADHPGPCNGQLIDLSTGQVTNLGQQVDCIAKGGAYTANLPTKTCTNCVIKIRVSATHLAPKTTEIYDSCMDVNISGTGSGSGGSGGDTGGSAPAPAPTATKPGPAPTTAPSTGDDSDDDSSDGGDDDGSSGGSTPTTPTRGGSGRGGSGRGGSGRGGSGRRGGGRKQRG